MIICAGNIEQFDFAKPVGIGLENVAINLTRMCMLEKPASLFFVGTAGSYGEKNIFEILVSQKATQIEQSVVTEDAYTPLDETVKGIASLEEMAEIQSFFKDLNVSRETVVNSSNYITTNEAAGAWYRQRGIHLENMEFYAVLKVAKAFNIPAAGVFIVTNYCNTNAHNDFTKNHQEAMERLTKYVEKLEIRN